ncbi:hypothetical protein BS47DRAFT_50266 [Hydnum rufescens UP504]|uniref:Uncharacterized protein n=1 Tax=Hydnum rufescens UP504 TaxID=1448309 RepID=A0A9P6ATQ8_9AGAM|nr:hypothetical protein BS47DRAFT_50266 [Hydnum rufescens UP504]
MRAIVYLLQTEQGCTGYQVSIMQWNNARCSQLRPLHGGYTSTLALVHEKKDGPTYPGVENRLFDYFNPEKIMVICHHGPCDVVFDGRPQDSSCLMVNHLDLPDSIASVVALVQIPMRPSIPLPNRFLRRSTPFYTCILFLACLVLFNTALLTLRETHFFEKHLLTCARLVPSLR